jgi:hypothetical protein
MHIWSSDSELGAGTAETASSGHVKDPFKIAMRIGSKPTFEVRKRKILSQTGRIEELRRP